MDHPLWAGAPTAEPQGGWDAWIAARWGALGYDRVGEDLGRLETSLAWCDPPPLMVRFADGEAAGDFAVVELGIPGSRVPVTIFATTPGAFFDLLGKVRPWGELHLLGAIGDGLADLRTAVEQGRG